jgi:hypothetical protein
VCPDVPRKLFVWPVEWGTFAYARRLHFVTHGPCLATTRPGSTPPPFLSPASLACRGGLQLLEQLRDLFCTDIEQNPTLAFNLDRMQGRLDTNVRVAECFEAAPFSCLALVDGAISRCIFLGYCG